MQEFLLVNELMKRALREMDEEHKGGRDDFHFCDCEDLYLTLVALYGDENHLAFNMLDATLVKVSNTINKMYPVEGSIRMGHLGQPMDSNRYGFFIE